jgi:multidrug efflux pump
MNITDIFIKRPVLATVVSLLILVLGLRSIGLLPVREYPETENAVVTIATAYPGADPASIAGFITTPLENAVAQAEGIDYLTSKSSASRSAISANLRLNYDSNKALTEITTKVNSVLNQLPKDANPPIISVEVGDSTDSMYIGFYSTILPANKITDYLIRVVQPKLQAEEGVQQAEILGERKFAMRVWLDPMKLAAYDITAVDVSQALAANNFLSAAGRTDGSMTTYDITAKTGLSSVEEFRNLIIKSANGAIVRLQDVGNVTLGSNFYDMNVRFDGQSAVYMGIKVAPTANILTVIKHVREAFPGIEAQLPQGLDAKIVYDATKYVNNAIHEVEHSLIEAMLIVTAVIFLFLGSFRSVIIPVITIPLSLVGAFFVMLILGYSVNLLTLLALVLAIGLVVDDAIIVVENIHRHLEAGMSRTDAALKGAKELANPIIAITIVLIAVYVPIGFMGGLTGALFTEFAFTLAGAVTISAIAALTLSPMMCSKLLKPMHNGEKAANENKLVLLIDRQFERLSNFYNRILTRALNHLGVIALFAAIVLSSIYFLYAYASTELAPQEDQGLMLSFVTAAPNATLDQTGLYSRQVYEAFASFPETDHVFQLDGVNGLNTSIAGNVLKPWDERKRKASQIQPLLQDKLNKIAGAQVAIFQPPPLPGSGGGMPLQFVLGTTESYERLNEVSSAFLDKARATGLFAYIDNDLKFDKAQTSIEFDRDKAAQMGLNMQNIGGVLASTLSGSYVNYFNLAGRSYEVIPQVTRNERQNQEQLLDYYLKASDGSSVPLSTVARIKTIVIPEVLNHFQQLNSATIAGILMPGVTQGQALAALDKIAKETLPQNYSVDFASQSRQYMQESQALMVTFFFALLIIFLALAALFESFRDPLIVLISVPMSICGAMIFINLGVGGATLNIYTEVGLVTLIGLISKHGILIVQFANDLQKEGKSKREAVQMAATIRLRPILMTTASMVLGVMPLLLATGAGAESRFSIGLVISSGIAIGTLFTLFVVPGIYTLLAQAHHKEDKNLNMQTSTS